MEIRKKAVSIRLNANDLTGIKRLATRLGVRDSDVIRAAVKLLLAKLAPLHDPNMKGRNLVPVFVECGNDLFRHFELDARRLESIVNDGVSTEGRVDSEDLQLIAMSAVQRSYLKLRLENIEGGHNGAERNGSAKASVDERSVDQTLRQYLYDKYVYGASRLAGLNSNAEAK